MRRRLSFVALSLWAVLAAAPAADACQIQQEASVPFRPSPFGPVVATGVNGEPADFVLDTGAVRSVLDEAAVARLRLPLDEWAMMTSAGIGGGVRHRVANLGSFTLGGARLRRRSVANDMSVAVVPALPSSEASPPIAGLLGGDYLAFHDIEFDPVARSVTLHAVRDCTGRFLPWTTAYDAVAATRPNLSWFVVPVLLDGHRLQALLDTGSASSFLTPRGAHALGVPLLAPGQEAAVVRGVGPRSLSARQQIFQSLTVGSETLRGVSLLVVPYAAPGIDMVLGADWLLRRHVWLSNATSQMFVIPEAPAAAAGNTSQ